MINYIYDILVYSKMAKEHATHLEYFLNNLQQNLLFANRNWKKPIMAKGIWSLLGLANFYGNFIKIFSQMMKPLLDLLKKKLSFECNKEQQRVFKYLKEKLSSIFMLEFLDVTKPFKVHMNVNDFTIKGVFMQDGHLIVF